MATISTVRTALQTTLAAALTGLTAYVNWPDQPLAPAALIRYIGPVDTQYATFAGNAYDEYEVTVIFSLAALPSAAEVALDAYVSKSGSSSLQAALEAAPTLGGVVDFAVLDRWSDVYGDVEIGDHSFMGAVAHVHIWHV